MDDEALPDGRSQRRLDNRARIYDAAIKLVRRRAYDELSIDEICEAAGVGRATFFRIFETKAGLLREFNRRLTVRVRERLDDELPATSTGALQIVADEIVSTWSQAAPGAAEMAIDFMRSKSPAGAHAAHPELLDLVVDIVQTGVKRGEIRGTNPPRLTGGLALTQLAAAAGYWLDHPGSDLEQLVSEALTCWLDGARADA